MTNDPISSWRWVDHSARSLEEAIAELEREVGVRCRIFDGWIQAGKLSRVDAWDRMERMLSALFLLRAQATRESEAVGQIAEGDHPPAIEESIRADQKGIVVSLDSSQAAA